MNVENSHTLGGQVVTNDTSAACLIEAEKDRFRRLESKSQPAASQA
jgi:hypothetical protein